MFRLGMAGLILKWIVLPPFYKTIREVLRRALRLHFSNIKFLKGGLAAWKAEGYPVELLSRCLSSLCPKPGQMIVPNDSAAISLVVPLLLDRV